MEEGAQGASGDRLEGNVMACHILPSLMGASQALVAKACCEPAMLPLNIHKAE